MDRNFSVSRLCKRLGDFKPGYYSERIFHKPAPEPVSHVCRKEWREYQKERRRQEEKKNARERWEKEREKLERQQRERRKTDTTRLARHGLSLLNIAQHFLTTQEQEEKRRCGTVSLNQKNRNDFRVSSTGLVSIPRILRISGVSANGLPRREGQTTGIPQSRLASPYTAYWEMVKKRFPEGCVIENG